MVPFRGATLGLGEPWIAAWTQLVRFGTKDCEAAVFHWRVVAGFHQFSRIQRTATMFTIYAYICILIYYIYIYTKVPADRKFRI